MAKVVLVCPFCQKRLETSAENIGREGQCPGCENVFPVTAPERNVPGLAASPGAAGEYEYQDTEALLGIAALAGCLVLLLFASTMPWVKRSTMGADFMPSEQLGILLVSVICIVYMGISFLARKSLVPVMLVAGAWGTVVVIWTGGIVLTLHNAAMAAENLGLGKSVRDSISVRGGIYLALAAGILAVVAVVYFYYVCRATDTFRRIGAFLWGTQVAAVTAGLLIVFLHVEPAVHERLAQASINPPPQFAAPAPPAAHRP
jgi:hypothetical protein